MQFQVPQFETENKLFGPFTIAQFLYVGISAVISFLLFPVLTTWFWFIISSFLVGTSLIIALMKVRGRSMPIFITAAFRYFWEPKVLTIRQLAEPITPVIETDKVGLQRISPLSTSKKFDIPKQIFSAEELAMPPAHPSVETPIESVIASVDIPVESPVFPTISSMPVSTSPAQPMKISPTNISVTPSAPAPATTFRLHESGKMQMPITPAVSAVPFVAVPLPVLSADSSPFTEPKRSRLQSLFNKLTTTSSPLLFREESMQQSSSKQKGYEFVEKLTGETIVAKRVDYR